MGTYIGTALSDTIIPGFVSAGVFRFPLFSTPGAGADSISGGGGNDLLDGGGGNDNISGGAGNDSMFGGTGNDTMNGDDGNDSMNGGTGNDTLIGGAGDDTLNGSTGIDNMNGGFGNDTYVVDHVLDVAAEVAGGIDRVIASVSHTLSANMENLVQTGVANITGVGNARANVIDGNGGSNLLSGLGGNDLIRGNNGNDSLFGGLGNDQLRGGAGNDRLIGGPGTDVLVGGLGNDVFAFTSVNDSFPGGRDTIIAGDGAVAFQGAGITLFGAPNDRIDLSAIDANAATAVNDAFVFGGTGTGRVSLANVGTQTVVRANVDGDAAFELEIAISDGAVLASTYWAGDFIL